MHTDIQGSSAATEAPSPQGCPDPSCGLGGDTVQPQRRSPNGAHQYAPNRPSALYDLGMALSLANLYQLRVWTSILCPPSVSRAQHAAAISNTVILAFALWGLILLLRRVGAPRLLAVARGILVLALVARVPSVVRALSPAVETMHWFGPAKAVWLSLAAVAIAAALAAKRGPVLTAMARRVLLALLPAVAVTLGHSSWHLAALGPGPVAAGSRDRVSRPEVRQARPRVVLLLLDELDYHVAFVARPPSVRLPALDRLRREALWATHSYPPSAWTASVIGAWLTGKMVDAHRLTADGGIEVRFAGSREMVELRDQRTLCTELREWGMRFVVVSSVLPYARVLGGDARCIDPHPSGKASSRLSEEMLGHFLTAAADVPMPLPQSLVQVRDALPAKAEGAAYRAFAAAAERCAADPSAHFTLLHANVPHRPFIFDRVTGHLTADPRSTYFDNLVLADRTLARIRSGMEESGEWDPAVVLVVSDHWWRARPAEIDAHDHRTLFALKLPCQSVGVEYPRPFNTVLMHDLLVALLRRELRQPGDVVQWLDSHRTFGESPQTVGLGPF